jgi:hypothetical protein
MPVKDRIVTWWIKNIIIPQQEIIDKPGFVITSFSGPSQKTYLRDVFFAEKLFELIENLIIQHYGEQGKKTLYSAGKKFAYLYASLSDFPTIKDHSKKAVADFAYLFVRYCEGVFAKQAKHEIDIDQKIFTISFQDYVICRHNGYGFIMTDGGCAGTWAYLMQDKSLEGTQLECEGRGKQNCYVLCASPEKIKERTNNFFCETNLLDLKFEKSYKTLNEVRQTTYAQNSLRTLIDANFFDFRSGILSYKGNRFLGSESHILYILEQEISKLNGGEKVLFDACFEYGSLLQKIYGHADYKKFIMDFFPALGFGDISVSSSGMLHIVLKYYPWTTFSEQSKFIIIRGIMSGFVSSIFEKKVDFNNFDIDVGSYLTLTIKV